MALVRSGSMDRRITLKSLTLTRGADGGTVKSWSDLATVWAQKLDQRGREFMAAMTENAELTTLFRLRWRDDVVPAMRLSCEGKDYNIVSITELGRRQWLEITATAVLENQQDFTA